MMMIDEEDVAHHQLLKSIDFSRCSENKNGETRCTS